MTDSASITELKGVGPHIAERLARLGITHVNDLLFHLPMRYEDRTGIQAIAGLLEGEEALIQAVVEAAEIKSGRRRRLLCLLNDGSGSLMLCFFHFSAAQQQSLKPGVTLRCFGEVRQGYDCLEMVHPEYQQVNPEHPPPVEANLNPVYPSTEGVHQNLLRRLAEQALAYPVADCLPEAVLKDFGLPGLTASLQAVHHPAPDSDLEALSAYKHPAQQRLAFEELLAHQLSVRMLRTRKQKLAAPRLDNPGQFKQRLLAGLPFSLTAAQQRAEAEIRIDLAKPVPMQRLVQGDVGSGKTVVAALAALQALESGYQAAVMAPTELLAEQHLRTFTQWLEPLEIPVIRLTSSLTKKQRQNAIERIAAGETALSVGTHALFQEDVRFAKLGLVIIDEQHRFGVHQRLALRDKGRQTETRPVYPHQLIMTATPIPRTLTMTAYADLDISVIDELPPGRTPVTTVAVADARREEVMQRVANACKEQRQAYWVCTLIDESESLQCQAAEDTFAQLREGLPALRIGLVHGRMKAKEKEPIMADFKAGKIDLLVATTVIEVGVDVPNASLMIIENAERLGLAQLHQLRGRVGRGAAQSYCVLLYKRPLSEIARSRLGTIRETRDGFAIAQRDLELRGPGEVLGTKQTGITQLRIADLQRDGDLLQQVTKAAAMILKNYPDNARALVERWVKEGLSYGDVC
ncbi:MAG: ATP-dependent DNA helicase RecG [Gammaproteobacteria bacterium]|nr:ATP-dependent DNA helicase RecG [Gammaproteobacteria bacterium]